MVKATIVNVVATACLNQELDFYALKELDEVFYDSDVYGGRVAYLKIKNMTGQVSLFPSGKMISVGTKDEIGAFNELVCAMRFLAEKKLVKIVELKPKIQNIVVSVDFEKRFNDLSALASRTMGIYKPERFPALILRIREPCAFSVLVFASGKAVISGLKDSKCISSVIDKVREVVQMNFENKKSTDY